MYRAQISSSSQNFKRMIKKSLLARNNDLANTKRQIEILSNGIFKDECCDSKIYSFINVN